MSPPSSYEIIVSENESNGLNGCGSICTCFSPDITWIVGTGPVIEKSKSSLRWLILVFACFMLIGSYYCYDIPAALKTQIDDYMGDPDDYETYFGLLYTLYSIPNVILPFFGGYFVDKIGVRLSMLIFASLIAIGQVLFSIGISFESWPIMFLGRFVFGLGGESLVVANSALLADWFKDKELAFAFGINLSIARLGSVFNNLLSPKLTDTLGLVFACWFGSLLCGASVLCVVATIPIDKAFDMKLEKLRTPLLLNNSSESETEGGALEARGNEDGEGHYTIPSKDRKPKVSFDHYDDSRESSSESQNQNPLWKKASFESNSTINNAARKDSYPKTTLTKTWIDGAKQFIKETLSLPHVFWVLVLLCVVVYGCVLPFNNIASSLLLERNYFKAPPSGCELIYSGLCQSSSNPPNNQCPSNPWYQPPLPSDVTVNGIYYSGQVQYADVDCTVSAWSDDCTVEFCNRLSTGETQAALIMSIPYIISAVMSPILGFGIDQFGLRAVIASLAPILLVIVHCLLGLTTLSPVGPLVGQGLAYTGFAAVLWPAVPIVIEEELTGLAFGIVTSSLNLATAVIPLTVAAIYLDDGSHYIPNVEMLFVGLASAGVVVGFYLNIYDIKHGHILNQGSMFLRQDYMSIDATENKANDTIFRANSPVTMSYIHGVQSDRPSTESESYTDQVQSRSHSSSHSHSHSHNESPKRRTNSSSNSTNSASFDPHSHHNHPRHSKGSFSAYEEVHRGGAI